MFSLMANCFTWIKKRREPFKKVTLLMVGLDNAGKTSTIADLKGDTTDGITPTVGFLMSSFTLNRFNVTVFDLGGGTRIRSIWKNYYAEVYGVVFVVDASDVNRLEESRKVLHEVKSNLKVSGKPLLVLANKQDIDGALNEEDIAHHLELNSLVQKHKCACQVFTCTAVLGQTNKVDKQIKKGFKWLLGSVSENFGALSERVTKDVAEQKEQQAKELQARRERVRLAREERERAEREAAERAKQLEEESDEDVVIGKGRKSKTPEPMTPEKQKKKKKKKKKKKQLSLENSENEEGGPMPKTQNEEENRVRFQDGEESDRSPHLVPPKSKPFVGSTDEIQPLSNGEVVTPEIVEGKKKKKKKKKKRANKTAPAPDNDDDENIDKLPPLAWGTPPATLNGFPGSSGLGLRRLEPLGPLTGRNPLPPFTTSSIAEGDEEPIPLAPLRTANSWVRTRPNSEDHDIIT